MGSEILDTSALIEGKRGCTTVLSIVEFPSILSEVPDLEVLWPEREDYVRAIELSVALYQKGTPVPTTDILIAAMALGRECPIVTTDRKHFSAIAAVAPELAVELIE